MTRREIRPKMSGPIRRRRPAKRPAPRAAPHSSLEIFVLAGGKSSRMGTDKSKAILAGMTLLDRVVRIVRTLGVRTRLVRRDAVPRCGPLGGVLTGLRRARAGHVLFLSCDMPLIRSGYLRRLAGSLTGRRRGVFTGGSEGAGFPFILRRECAREVGALIAEDRLALQALAALPGMTVLPMPRRQQSRFININTRSDLSRAEVYLLKRTGHQPLRAGNATTKSCLPSRTARSLR